VQRDVCHTSACARGPWRLVNAGHHRDLVCNRDRPSHRIRAQLDSARVVRSTAHCSEIESPGDFRDPRRVVERVQCACAALL
jgi:hypothetical protein